MLRAWMALSGILVGWAVIAGTPPIRDTARAYPEGTPPPVTLRAVPNTLSKGVLRLRTGCFDPLEEDIPDSEALGFRKGDGVAPTVFIVQFHRTLNHAEIEGLESGPGRVRFLDYLPPGAYLVRCDAAGRGVLRKAPAFRWMGPYEAFYKVEPRMLQARWRRPLLVDVRFFPGAEVEGPARKAARRFPEAFLLARRPGGLGGRVLRFRVPPERIHDFARMAAADPGVWSVDPFFLPHPHNDHSVWVIQSYDTVNRTNYALSATIWNHGITGTGQFAAVCDSGLDSDMCYFRHSGAPSDVTDAQYPSLPGTGTIDPSKKIAAYYVIPGATAYDNNAVCGNPVNWHGTHTTGSVLGDNYASPSGPTEGGHDFGDGMAPNARGIFQDVGDDGGCFVGLANDYGLIFEQARAAGARVHSDSWGSDTAGAYTSECVTVDRYLWDHEDMLVVYSSGNVGPAEGTVGSPASAKNCLSVGALSNGFEDAETVASFSSRGPTTDGRVKPDVSAPGLSVYSASGDSSHTSDNCIPKIMSGTSMAAPTVAGGAVLLRQYFTDGFYPSGIATPQDGWEPSAALLKAALVAGAMDISVPDIPGTGEGWGRIRLDGVCFFAVPERDAMRTRIWDRRNEAGLAMGDTESFSVSASDEVPLKAVLAWTDPPSSPIAGIHLVNDLDLEARSPSGTLYRGNALADGVSVEGGAADGANNVEVIHVPAPEAGEWTLTVHAASVPGTPALPESDRQGYALVVTRADCTGVPGPPGGITASEDGETGITLSWSSVTGADAYEVYRSTGGCGNAETYVGTTDAPTYLDRQVQGGYAYEYRVRAANGCGAGEAGSCEAVTYTGNCTLEPDFEGLEAAVNDPSTSNCDVVLSWSEGVSRCPQGPGLRYNVYRMDGPYDVPGPACLLAGGVPGRGYRDREAASRETRYYVVRAEDGTSSNGGPGNGGNEDGNTIRVNATAESGVTVEGVWTDDGGDGAARLALEGDWSITNQDNHTGGGALSYHTALDFYEYSANACISASTPTLSLGAAPVLSYWARYNLEEEWDGVVVEVSGDGGQSWAVSDPDGGYPGSFAQTGDPPINACGFSSIQACINGPPGNGSPTSWLQFTHDLSAWAGGDAVIRWRLSTDPAVAFEGLYLDDIEVSPAGVAEPCATACIHTVDVRPDGAQTTCDGETLTFGVSVGGGTAPYAYQWTEDGADLEGGTDVSLSVMKEAAGIHAYNCWVTDQGCYAGDFEESTGIWEDCASCDLSCSASAIPDSGVAPLSVAFAADAWSADCTGTVAYAWNFGDGGTSGEQNSTHVYQEGGSYAWTLTATLQDAVCTRQGTVTVTDPCSVTCHASADPDAGQAPLDVQFSATVIQANCTGEIAYEWAFGDGESSTLRRPAHTYEIPGEYTWTFTASVDGETCEDSGTVAVTSASCVVACEATWNPGSEPLHILFASGVETTDCVQPAATLWDFGDGSTSLEADPEHIYGASGTYEVALEAEADGVVCISGTVVTVEAPCTVDCAADAAPSSGEAPLDVAFSAVLVPSDDCQGPEDHSWTFGDGMSSEQQNPAHVYEEAGEYDWAYAGTVDGVSCRRTGRITVGEGCTVTCSAQASPADAYVPMRVLFFAEAASDGCSGEFAYQWDFGDGGTGSGGQAEHVYAVPGEYGWTLTASLSGETCVVGGTLAVPRLPGDGDLDGIISIGEVQQAVNMFLGATPPANGADADGNGTVSIGELQSVINSFLSP